MCERIAQRFVNAVIVCLERSVADPQAYASIYINERVEGRGLEPGTVADRLDLNLTGVYEALLYYHENPATFAELREEKQNTLEDEDLGKYPDGVVTDES